MPLVEYTRSKKVSFVILLFKSIYKVFSITDLEYFHDLVMKFSYL